MTQNAPKNFFPTADISILERVKYVGSPRYFPQTHSLAKFWIRVMKQVGHNTEKQRLKGKGFSTLRIGVFKGRDMPRVGVLVSDTPGRPPELQ